MKTVREQDILNNRPLNMCMRFKMEQCVRERLNVPSTLQHSTFSPQPLQRVPGCFSDWIRGCSTWLHQPRLLVCWQGHPGTAWWVREQSIFCNFYQVLFAPTPYRPCSKRKHSVPFLCIEWEGGNVFQTTTKQRSHLIFRNRTSMWVFYHRIWGTNLIPSSKLLNLLHFAG